MPLDGDDQLCMGFELTVDPHVRVFEYTEEGGPVHHFSIRYPHRELKITATAVVATYLEDPFKGLNLIYDDWRSLDQVRESHLEFVMETPYVRFLPQIKLLADSVQKSGSVANWVIHLGNKINELLAYDPDVTHVHTTLPEVLSLKAGVCQDFAHLMLACLRMSGVPSRYVSGYLYVGENESFRGAQATHAWVEVLLPDGRWLGIDPTNRQLANDHYIRVHTGTDYSEVTPTRGIFTGTGTESLDVGVRITRDHLTEEANRRAIPVKSSHIS